MLGMIETVWRADGGQDKLVFDAGIGVEDGYRQEARST